MFPNDTRCLVFLPSCLISHPVIRLIDVIYLNRWGRQRCSPRHSYSTMFLQKKTRLHRSPPRRRLLAIPTSNILFPLPVVFWKSVEIIHALFSFPPFQRGHCEVTASISPTRTHHLLDGVSERGLFIKSHIQHQ